MINLPKELIDLIYEYDCTKKENFDKVLDEFITLYNKLDRSKCSHIKRHFYIEPFEYEGKLCLLKSKCFLLAYKETRKFYKKGVWGRVKECWNNDPTRYLLY